MDRVWRARATTASMIGIGAISLACLTVPYTNTTRYTRQQSAVVMPPSGPHATGALPTDGQTTIELAGEATYGAPAARTREQGAPGHAIPQVTGRLRLAHGLLDRIEVGMDLEVAAGSLARITASDLPHASYDGNWLVRGGFQVRGIVAGSRRFGLGLGAEASVGNAPYSASISYVTTSTASGGGGSGSSWDQTVFFMPTANAGLFLHGMPTESLALLGGVIVQTAPRFEGQQVYSETCTYGAGAIFGACSYSPNPWPAQFTLRPVGTLWASASYSFGHVVLVGQFFANVLADPEMMNLAPFGGTLAVRLAY